MTKIDPEQERQRLAELYADKSDLELEKVGADPSALTDWARKALSEEMKKRGLEWKPAPRAAIAIKEDEILVLLAVYTDRNAAAIDKEYLEGAGVKSFLCEKQRRDSSDSSTLKAPEETQLLVRAGDLLPAQQQLSEKYAAETATAEEIEGTKGVHKPVILRRYRDMPAAFVEKSALENAGIQCFLQDDNVVRMDWFWSNAMGGIKLIVREKDAADAAKVLDVLAQGSGEAGLEG
jgi:hypothetical protein